MTDVNGMYKIQHYPITEEFRDSDCKRMMASLMDNVMGVNAGYANTVVAQLWA